MPYPCGASWTNTATPHPPAPLRTPPPTLPTPHSPPPYPPIPHRYPPTHPWPLFDSASRWSCPKRCSRLLPRLIFQARANRLDTSQVTSFRISRGLNGGGGGGGGIPIWTRWGVFSSSSMLCLCVAGVRGSEIWVQKCTCRYVVFCRKGPADERKLLQSVEFWWCACSKVSTKTWITHHSSRLICKQYKKLTVTICFL